MTQAESTTTGESRPGFSSAIRVIDEATKERMSASSRDGCPVPLDDLRLLEVSHWGFDGSVHTGEIVVHGGYARDVVSVFEESTAETAHRWTPSGAIR